MPERTTGSGWTRVAFGDVVRRSEERSANPEHDGFERYVGLEHIDAGDLKIRRWGNISGGTTFTNVFRSGQVLFGKRRAYQGKVAVVSFDGVCSGDIYALEPKTAQLLPELLLLICQTKEFFTHAVGTSAGSLSPRTNWESLARYEFALPPPEEQRRMVELLSAIDTADEHFVVAMDTCAALTSSFLDRRFRDGNAKTMALSDVASVERGKFSHRPRNLPEFYGGDADFVQTGDVAASRGILGPASKTLSELGKQYGKSFAPGTVLVTIAAVIGATAVTTREVWCPDSVVGIFPNSNVLDAAYLELVLRRLRPVLDQREATSSTQKNINLAILRPLRIPILPLGEQKRVAADLEHVEQASVALSSRRGELGALRQSMLTGRA